MGQTNDLLYIQINWDNQSKNFYQGYLSDRIMEEYLPKREGNKITCVISDDWGEEIETKTISSFPEIVAGILTSFRNLESEAYFVCIKDIVDFYYGRIDGERIINSLSSVLDDYDIERMFGALDKAAPVDEYHNQIKSELERSWDESIINAALYAKDFMAANVPYEGHKNMFIWEEVFFGTEDDERLSMIVEDCIENTDFSGFHRCEEDTKELEDETEKWCDIISNASAGKTIMDSIAGGVEESLLEGTTDNLLSNIMENIDYRFEVDYDGVSLDIE